jgi:crotonobetainyl-CoA:carnitine CoA-transferase CaiB-like acyl-CoA transferase
MSSDSRAPSRPPRPLDGITVVAIEHAIAAPFCTRQLADLGARVIKVERPGTGDFARQYDSRVNGLASHFVWTSRSKESIALDVKNPEARAEVVARLDAAGIANARINTVADVWTHPQLAARGRWSEVDTPSGRVPALKPPAMLDGVEARMDKVPALGEHTASILRELGVSTERIDRLCRDRAVQMED